MPALMSPVTDSSQRGRDFAHVPNAVNVGLESTNSRRKTCGIKEGRVKKKEDKQCFQCRKERKKQRGASSWLPHRSGWRMVPSSARRDGLANLNVAFLWKGERVISIREGIAWSEWQIVCQPSAAGARFINIRRAAAFYHSLGVRPLFLRVAALDAYLEQWARGCDCAHPA